jgi:hypothetical protein
MSDGVGGPEVTRSTGNPLAVNTAVVQREAMRRPTRRVILDIDSSESPVHGAQEQSAYNGHFESVCYHPLFVFNQEGDCLAAKLRPGNVPSARGWEKVLLPIIDRYRAHGQTVVTPHWCATGASTIKRPPGTGPDG